MNIKDTQSNDKTLAFWKSIFSNFHLCNFKYKGLWFYNSEQAFMWAKAMHFNDAETAVLLLKEKNPKKCQELGRSVKNYDDASWSSVRYDVMVDVLTEKFKQNKNLSASLLSTNNKVLVEGSPIDKVWGVGIHWEDSDCLIQSKWKGQNLLGKALMDVRGKLN